MILGYEEPVLMPTMDIYSTDLMKMYIEGVKEQYKEGLEEYKDFMKQYQDFYSSLPGANEYWYNNTIKPALDLIALAAAQGVDLFKSPEGRAAIRNMINSVPLGKLKLVQAASEDYDKYLDSVAKLQEQNKYNPAFLDFILSLMYPGGYQLVDKNGNINPWKTRSATPYEDMTTYTAPWFEGMKDTYLGTTPDGKYNLMGINEEAMQPILDQNMSDYLGTPLGQFHFKQFVEQLPPGITPEQAFAAFLNEIMAKNRRIQHVEREADPYAKDDHSTANDIRAHARNAAIDDYYAANRFYREHPEYNPNSPFYAGDPNAISVSRSGTRGTTPKGVYSHFLAVDDDSYAKMNKSYENGASGSNVVYVYDKTSGKKVRVVEDPNGTLTGAGGKKYKKVDNLEMLKVALKDGKFDAISTYEDNVITDVIRDRFSTGTGNDKNIDRDALRKFIVAPALAFNNAYGGENRYSLNFVKSQYLKINEALAKDKIELASGNKSFVVYNKDGNTKSAYTRLYIKSDSKKGTKSVVEKVPVLFKYAEYLLLPDGTWVLTPEYGSFSEGLDHEISNKKQGKGTTYLNTED